jgi:hypothetical protein
MKEMIKKSSLLFFSFFFVSSAFAERQLIQTVEIDCRANCAIYGSKKWKEKAKEIKLSPGKYKFIPSSGACSVWAKDQIAYDTGSQPWMWYAIISANITQYELGSLAKYETPKKALQEQKDEEVIIALENETLIQIGIEDSWKGKDYCSDNRGVEKIEIYKITLAN